MDKPLKKQLLNDLYNYYKPIEKQDVFYGLIDLYLFSRIKPILSKCKSYIFETDYIENQWKEMVTTHYINTSYKIKKTVARIHFFDNTSNKSVETYLGYVTLRPFSEYDSILSTIMPNLKKFSHNDSIDGEIKFLSYKKTVHIDRLCLTIDTFAFFAQDGVVARCAHADMLMITTYLNHTYGYNRIKLSKMKLNHLYAFPNEGLDEFEIVELLDDNDIPAKIYSLEDDSLSPMDLIKVYVESGLPVIIGYDDHVILVIGIAYHMDGNVSFVIYDDSGSFVSQDETRDCGSFMSIQHWNTIKTQKDKCVIIPVHERLYSQYPVTRALLNIFLNTVLYGIDMTKGSGNITENIYKKIPNIQTIMVEMGQLKIFLKQYENHLCELDYVKSSYETLKNNNQLHYMWVTYFRLNNKYSMIVLTDPTLNPDSIHTIMPYLIFDKEIPFNELKIYLH